MQIDTGAHDEEWWGPKELHMVGPQVLLKGVHEGSLQHPTQQILQTNPMAFDFKHNLPKRPLLMYGWYNPSWVKEDKLRLDDTGKPWALAGVHKVREEDTKKNHSSCDGGWWTLSLDEALPSLEEGVPSQTSVEDFARILHRCRKERDRAHALCLHAHMSKSGLEAHRLLGNYLVWLLVEVGCMRDAQQVFERLVYRNAWSWNSLITGYINSGNPQHAFTLFEKMQEDDSVHPSGHTFVALLKVCGNLKDLERGMEIHTEVARTGFLERDVFVGSTLLDMYLRCGSLVKAQEVFDKLPFRNVVSWTALIAGYSKHGHAEEALKCFEQMQLEGVSPDAVTIICSLKACGSIRATYKGQKIHVEIERRGLLEKDIIVGNTLVDMYAKCGLLAKAQEVFDRLPVRNVVSWTTLIAGYAEHGCGEEALNCFQKMQLEGISPNAVTFVCSLKACGSIGATDKGCEIHAQIERKRLLERDLFVGSTLVDMYAKCGSLIKAQEVFDKLPVRNLVSWNALTAGYAELGYGEEALNCYEKMQREGIPPDAVTFICSLKACGSIGATDKGLEIHAEIERRGLLERDRFVGSALVDMYAKCGLLAKAKEVFDKLPVRNVISWNALIAGYAEHGRSEEALNCFEKMQAEGVSPDTVTFICSLKACGSIGSIDKGQEIHAEIFRKGLLEKDVVVGNTLVDMYAKCGSLAKAQEVFDKLSVRDIVSWNALIAGYGKDGHGEQALECFEQMQIEGVSPNAVTFICSLKACGSIGATDKGEKIHAEIERKGLLERDLFVGTALVDMYAKCGSLAIAQRVFDMLPVRGVVSWNSLIAGYAQLGESENVFHVFDRMLGEGIKPNLVTFVIVLNACSQTGLSDKGQTYFETMSKDYGISPTFEHHTCMVDLLGRAGRLDKAVALIKKLPFYPDLSVWHTVLGACRKWGNVELGRQAFKLAVRLDEKKLSAYALLSNIYAAADVQEEAKKVEALGVLKQAWSGQQIAG